MGPGTFQLALRNSTDGININTVHTIRVIQSLYNINALLFIRDKLGCGQIRPIHPMGKTMAGFPGVIFIDWTYVYSVQDKRSIGSIVIPTLKTYPLLTSKYYYFNLFQLALYEQFSRLPQLYKAEHSVLPTKSWIIGFIKAEGSFHINNNKGFYYHEFSINQNLDIHLLVHIRNELGITSNITEERKKEHQLLLI